MPPPHTEVADCMTDLERFLNGNDLPVLVQAALAHVQFETIHPVLDDNGRVGQLLITCQLCHAGLLANPCCTSACTSSRTSPGIMSCSTACGSQGTGSSG